MFRFVSGLLILLVVCGCASLSLEKTSSSASIADTYLDALQERNYRESYELFADDFRNEISLQQHVGLMEILVEEMGALEDYDLTIMPFLSTTPMEAKILMGLPPEDVQPFTYDLVFEEGTVIAKITIVTENEEKKIGVFELIDVPFKNDPDVQEKVSALGL